MKRLSLVATVLIGLACFALPAAACPGDDDKDPENPNPSLFCPGDDKDPENPPDNPS